MNLLFIVPYVPSLVRVRSYQIIRHMKARGHRVVLATLWVDDQERAELERFSVFCDEVIAAPLPAVRSFMNCLGALPSSAPLQAVYSWDTGLWEQIWQRIQKDGPLAIDAVHIEHLRGSQYGVRLQQALSTRKGTPPVVVWDSVDCISHLFKQASERSSQGLKRWITQFDLTRTEKREGWLTTFFEHVLVTSPNDREALLRLASSHDREEHIKVIPNGVDLDYFQPGDSSLREKATLVVSGKMSYHANVSMVNFLIREVMPLVWRSWPEVHLNIVGKDPVPQILAYASNPGVTVTGTVSSLLPYLQSATAAVAPIQYGAGIQNKVLEAMACATPVIASEIAVSALSVVPGKEVLVANSPEEWARNILDLLASPEKQKELGEAGYKYVEANHRWSEIAQRLERIYSE